MSLTQINRAGLDEIALDHVFTIGASGSSAYTFQGEGLNGTVNNPTLYLTRGKTYRFENGSGGHPIRIQSTSGASGTAYNTGVTNNAGSGTVIVEVQHDAPDVLYYQCTSHAAMNGILYITGALADGGVTTAKLADDAVTQAKIADDAVTQAKIASGAITNDNIDSSAGITGGKLANNTIGAAQIAAGAITNTEIDSSAAIAGSKLADNSISLAKLEHGTSSNDGKFLRANNGADPTFETVSGTTINNNADNRLISGSDTANTLNGETYWYVSGASLGLGTTSPSANIHLRSSYVSMRIDSDGSNNHTNFYNITGTGKENRIHFGDAGDHESGGIIYDHNGDQMKFKVGGSERMRLDADGLTFNGDTAAANSLDDYEEGESTITAYSNSNVTISSSYNKMDYTKIGNLVTITGLIVISGVHSNSYFRISMPFTCRNESNPRRCDAIGSVMHNNISTGDAGLVCYLPMGQSVLNFYKVSNNSSWSILTNNDLAAGDEMYFTITYKSV